MGMVQVDIEIGHRDGGEMVRIPDVLVDTGSAHTTLPADTLEELHIDPIDHVGIVLPNGEEVEWGVGEAKIRIAGRNEEWTCPVYFCPREEYLLGATTLEIFGLMVDPIEHGLIRKQVRARSI